MEPSDVREMMAMLERIVTALDKIADALASKKSEE